MSVHPGVTLSCSLPFFLFLRPFLVTFVLTENRAVKLHALLETTPHKQISIHQKIALQYNS